jgi:hypothetical protein
LQRICASQGGGRAKKRDQGDPEKSEEEQSGAAQPFISQTVGLLVIYHFVLLHCVRTTCMIIAGEKIEILEELQKNNSAIPYSHSKLDFKTKKKWKKKLKRVLKLKRLKKLLTQ